MTLNYNSLTSRQRVLVQMAYLAYSKRQSLPANNLSASQVETANGLVTLGWMLCQLRPVAEYGLTIQAIDAFTAYQRTARKVAG